MTKTYMTFQYSLEETIEELQEHITSLKSLLSKAEEENKAYIKFKESVLNSIKDCREVEPNLATCFENTCGIIELESSLNKSKGEEE